MRRVTTLLMSTTALVTGFTSATPAAAQDQPAPPNPGATAQQSPAQPAQNADAPQSPAAAAGSDNSAIVVTGMRRSLQSARNVKRNSPQIVDAIVASDIGMLPEANWARCSISPTPTCTIWIRSRPMPISWLRG